jgi:hypothetical protein
MPYALIKPPFQLRFREMPRKELERYYRWFMEVMPQRVKELSKAVKDTPGFEAWAPDHSPASLDKLGDWFAGQVETRNRAKEEVQAIESRLTFPMEIPGEELTDRTFSLAMDIGMYFSQVLLKSYPSLKWQQALGSKKFVDYGQPVLVGFGPVSLNSVRITVTFAYGLASKDNTGKRLREIYDYWAKKVQLQS